MLRPRAVRALLLETVAGIAPAASGEDVPPGALEKAIRRALLVASVLAVGLVVLVAGGGARLGDLAGAGAVFTFAGLILAAAAGFRLGQWEKLTAVRRALEDLGTEE